jgi:hypothetical protein
LSTSAPVLTVDLDHLLVRPWTDPIVDQVGHDARSAYVERFWLGVLGPSATWFLRYVADRFDLEPDGFDLDLALCAASIGLGRHRGPTAAFPRMLNRCCQFNVARTTGPASIEVRRNLTPLSQRQVAKLSHALQAEHTRWVDTTPAAAEIAALSDRARRLALSLLELGEDPAGAERQLHRWRFHPAMAREAMTWALDRHRDHPDLASEVDMTGGRARDFEALDHPAHLVERATHLQHAREARERVNEPW